MKSCLGVAEWGTWCLPELRPWFKGRGWARQGWEPRQGANPRELQPGRRSWRAGMRQTVPDRGSSRSSTSLGVLILNSQTPGSCTGMQISPSLIHTHHPRGNLYSPSIPFQRCIKSSLTPKREFSELKILDGKKLLNNPNDQICFNICLAASSVWWEIKSANCFCWYKMLQCWWLLPVEYCNLFQFISIYPLKVWWNC